MFAAKFLSIQLPRVSRPVTQRLTLKRRILDRSSPHRATASWAPGQVRFENWVRLQDRYECFFLIADLHVLTTAYEHPERIQSNIVEVLADWIATGDRSAAVHPYSTVGPA